MGSNSNNDRLNVFSHFVLSCCALVFLLFYLLLSYRNRAASDDIYSILQFQELGATDLLSHYYNSWSGRWPTILYFSALMHFSDPFIGFHTYIFIYYIISMVILFFSVKYILNEIFRKSFNVLPDLTVYSFLFIAGIYFFSFQATEAWWWICSSFVYLQGIIALLAGIALLLKENKRWHHFILITLCFAYAGGSSEIYILVIVFITLFTFLFFKYFHKDRLKYFFNGPHFKSALLATVVFIISATVCLSAPGNRNRMHTDFKSDEKPVTPLIKADSDPIQIAESFSKKYPFALAICSLTFLLGSKLKRLNPHADLFSHPAKNVFIAFIPFLISVVVTWIFQKLILKEAQLPLRAWTFSSFLLTFFFCYLFFVIGFRSSEKANRIRVFSALIPSIVLIILLLNLTNQYKITSVYTAQYDQLIDQLETKKQRGEKDTLFVKPLPDPGMLVALYPQDKNISEGLESIMDLPFKISKTEEER